MTTETKSRGFAEVGIVTTLKAIVDDCAAISDYLNRLDVPVEMVEHTLDITGEVAAETRRLRDDFDICVRGQAREGLKEMGE